MVKVRDFRLPWEWLFSGAISKPLSQAPGASSVDYGYVLVKRTCS